MEVCERGEKRVCGRGNSKWQEECQTGAVEFAFLGPSATSLASVPRFPRYVCSVLVIVLGAQTQHQAAIQNRIPIAVSPYTLACDHAHVLPRSSTMSRSTSQSSTVTGTAANGLSRTLSLKTNTKTAPHGNLITPSDVKLFVTNLRLLDLDRYQDWPNITVQTFSSKNADQKQRIGGVEWALFRLFEIWDSVETSQVRV